jgi:hypothetical protein
MDPPAQVRVDLLGAQIVLSDAARNRREARCDSHRDPSDEIGPGLVRAICRQLAVPAPDNPR